MTAKTVDAVADAEAKVNEANKHPTPIRGRSSAGTKVVDVTPPVVAEEEAKVTDENKNSTPTRIRSSVGTKAVDVKPVVTEEEAKVNDENKPPTPPRDAPVSKVQHHAMPAPHKKRKQPLLIAEDSVFLPVPDAKTTETLAEDPVEQKRPVVLLERNSVSDLMISDANSSVAKTQHRRPSGNTSLSDVSYTHTHDSLLFPQSFYSYASCQHSTPVNTSSCTSLYLPKRIVF
ncbi:unnamed protein product [Dibothriocephalus latus]|uniref:Uncharacterized protein n=1 Tax=Dibothriocephalus latus TaxID=60516 RepID=A0A3P7M4I2_DIBLA|nr:unnamed protein product [Dibothriocephalus latus]